mmetsp:Transcript_17365/g.34106  ORF Transcript_17365/g.34106 Transcript_17365/m.34106 type:complete len:287 (-) Transcript_17365:169-1029(-)
MPGSPKRRVSTHEHMNPDAMVTSTPAMATSAPGMAETSGGRSVGVGAGGRRESSDVPAGVDTLAIQELAAAMELARPYFERVETKLVLRRLVHSMVPMHRATVALIADPDLFGPLMIVATEALLLQTAGFSLLAGILIAVFYWIGLSGGLYIALKRILHEFSPIAISADGGSPLSHDEETGFGSEDEGIGATRQIYQRPLRLDQLLCVCGYGSFAHCLLLGLTSAGSGMFMILCKLCVLLSSSACVALVVFRSLSVLTNNQVAALVGVAVILMHGLIWPIGVGRFP